jgi:hypothetical protein
MIPEVEVPLVRLVPAMFLAWLAWAVRRSPFKTAGNRILAAFLALVGLGFLLESLADLAVFPPGAKGVLRAAVAAIGVVDPPLLLALGLAFPSPRPALRSPALWMAVAAAAGATVAARLLAPAAAAGWASTAYVDAAYLAAFALLLRPYAQERQRVRERQAFFVVLGVGFAALSRAGGIFFEHAPARDQPTAVLLSSLAIYAALSALAYAGLRRWGAPEPRARGLLLPLLGLLVAFSSVYYVLASVADPLTSQWFALRWIVVGGVLGYGMLRHQLFDFELRTRQAVTFLASLAVGLLAGLAAADAVGGDGLAAAQAAGLAVGVAGTALAYAAGRWGWRRLRPGDELPLAYRQRRVELYQAALESSLAGAQLRLGEHLFAGTLRDVFAISQEEHEQVMARIAAQRPAPPAAPSTARSPRP